MKKVLIFFSLAVLILGCDVLSGQETVNQSYLEAQLKEINDFVQSGNCDNQAQCNYLPIGHKACGGPAGYVVFSDNIDVEALNKMIEKYTDDQRIYNKENNIISDCSMVNPPEKIGCIDGKCSEIRE